MKSVLPRSAEWIQKTDKFLADAASLLRKSLQSHKSSPHFKDLYRSCAATKATLDAMDSPKITPSLNALCTIALRIPLLMGAGQSSILKVELRRFIELTLWAVYFTDHPVEWQNFSGKRGAGFSRDAHKPISFSAHRELAAYFDYAKEYMEAEPSGIALLSLSRLLADNRQLNAAVHAGEIARSPLRNPPIETFTAAEAEKIASLTKRVLGHAIVVLAAFHKDGFDALPAGAKAHFDWLVGPRIKRQVRSGPFGLALSK